MDDQVPRKKSVGSWRSVLAIALVALVIISSFTFALTVGSSKARAYTPPFRSFNIGMSSLNVATYNPLSITLVDEYIVVYNTYSTLLSEDKNYQIRGDLAYNWTLSADKLNWTFHLAQNAYFTNPANPTDKSHQVTSADVVFSFRLNMNLSASILHAYTTQIKSVTALDKYTVLFTTFEPYAAMYSTAINVVILPQYLWSSVKNPIANGPFSYPVGSGAMYDDEINESFGSNIILRKSPNYYGDAYYCTAPRPDQVYFKDFSTPAQMVSDFQQGTSQLDAIFTIDPPSFLKSLPSTSNPNGIQKWSADTGFVGEIALNVASPEINSIWKYKAHNPLTMNATFRQAVAMSIDKQALVNTALLGLGHVADTLVPDTNPWHYSMPQNQLYPFNPQGARQMLMQAGWKYSASGGPAGPTQVPLYNSTGTPLSIRFYTLNPAASPEWQSAAINITAWLAQAGIQTTDATGKPGYGLYTVNQMNTIWKSGNYDMWLWDWVFTPASDPSVDVMEVETSAAIGPTSDNFYSNATYDAIYNESLTTLDPTARRALTDHLQSMVYNYASYILPYYRLDLYAATNGRPGVAAGAFPGWTNYGNWTTSVGLTPDSDLPNLWFQVAPLDDLPPQIQAFPGVTWVNGSAAPLSVTAADPQGNPLTYSWDFGDGSYLNATSNDLPTHTYALPGNYTIRVRVKGLEWSACSQATATIVTGGANVNLPPVARLAAVDPRLEYVGTGIPMNLTVSDSEGDPIYASWSFGDGATAANFTTQTSGNYTFRQVHTYTAAKTYMVEIRYSDNKTGIGSHTAYIFANYTIQNVPAPPQNTQPASNPWLNYGVPIVIVAAIVLAGVVIMLRRRKTAKKEEQEVEPEQPPKPPAP